MITDIALSPMGKRPARLVRRVEPSRAPFLPYGLAPLGALALLILFGVTFFSRGVEDAVIRTTQQALNSVGATWATAHVSGQWVTLEGAPPSREDAARVMAAVRGAKAGAMFGQAIPVTRVTERFVWLGDLAQPAAATSASTPAPESMPAAPAPAPQVDIIVPPAPAAACDQSLSALLGSARIEFATSSAIIGRGSAGLLDSVATAAAACPGTLVIEGHSDSSGNPLLNHDLSRRRAEAVRAALVQRGLPEERLIVEGFGASKPIASNATEKGRERNRRIEIHMASSPT
jgi:outer membrane protein OmpA-like peptidoglycan-associated protein